MRQLPGRREMMVSIITEGDDADLEQLRINLRRELSLLDEVAIQPVVSGQVPEGARGFDAVALGKLAVTFGPNTLRRLSSTVRAWLERSRARRIELTVDGDTIELDKASSQEQDQRLAAFVARHSSADDTAQA